MLNSVKSKMFFQREKRDILASLRENLFQTGMFTKLTS